MSLAKKCDCCGKIYECSYFKTSISEGFNAIRLIERNENNSKFEVIKTYDLCEDCLDKIGKVLKIKRVPNI